MGKIFDFFFPDPNVFTIPEGAYVQPIFSTYVKEGSGECFCAISNWTGPVWGCFRVGLGGLSSFDKERPCALTEIPFSSTRWGKKIVTSSYWCRDDGRPYNAQIWAVWFLWQRFICRPRYLLWAGIEKLGLCDRQPGQSPGP